MGCELLHFLAEIKKKKYRVFRNRTGVHKWCRNVFVTTKQGDCGVFLGHAHQGGTTSRSIVLRDVLWR